MVDSMASEKKWYDILINLQSIHNITDEKLEDIKSSLRLASSAVVMDEEWNKSGIKDLLLRALEMAARGSINCALKTALSLLDFYFIMEKYRGHSTQGKNKRLLDDGASQGSMASDDFCFETGAKTASQNEEAVSLATSEQPRKISKLAHTTDSGKALTLSQSSSRPEPNNDNATTRAASGLSERDASPALHVCETSGLQSQGQKADKSSWILWEGSVVLSESLRNQVVLCENFSLEIPGFSIPASASILVRNVVPRKRVSLGHYCTSRASFLFLTSSQKALWERMASSEMVALALFAEIPIVLVPYLNSSRTISVVGFMLL